MPYFPYLRGAIFPYLRVPTVRERGWGGGGGGGGVVTEVCLTRAADANED